MSHFFPSGELAATTLTWCHDTIKLHAVLSLSPPLYGKEIWNVMTLQCKICVIPSYKAGKGENSFTRLGGSQCLQIAQPQVLIDDCNTI